jgi:hypothetical protein
MKAWLLISVTIGVGTAVNVVWPFITVRIRLGMAVTVWPSTTVRIGVAIALNVWPLTTVKT